MFSKQFVVATAERAIKTAAQSAVAAIGTTAALEDLNWELVGGIVGLATLLSVLTSISSNGIDGPGPSLGAERLAPVPPAAVVPPVAEPAPVVPSVPAQAAAVVQPSVEKA
nr:holin [Kineosporia babensis]